MQNFISQLLIYTASNIYADHKNGQKLCTKKISELCMKHERINYRTLKYLNLGQFDLRRIVHSGHNDARFG